ncbi:hypothetical protein V7654_03775 [Bacillus sp. JJ1609]|uniref:hypothetical protein n=1 Tax=Bacillus sp. JJ1609 TaxID=3122977 RepID=UPI002FFDB511
MTTLNEIKSIHIMNYSALIEGIGEAFKHIKVCVDNLKYEETKELWNDILLAFLQIAYSHTIIIEIFADNPVLVKRFEQFEEVLEATELFAHEVDSKSGQIICDKIYPVFLVWKEQIDHELLPYYIN